MINIKHLSLSSLLLLSLTAAPALADKYDVDAAHSTLSFSIGHMGLTDIDGRFGDFQGVINWDPQDPNDTSVSFTAQAKSIDTGVAQRDDHLRTADFFEKYPTLTFKSTKVSHLGEDRYRVDGELTIHGVTRPVTTTARIVGPKDVSGTEKIGFRTTFVINRLDYKVGEGKFSADTMIGHNVFIEVKGEAAKAK
jgi:polyisoprenoid-binding protein YceI